MGDGGKAGEDAFLSAVREICGWRLRSSEFGSDIGFVDGLLGGWRGGTIEGSVDGDGHENTAGESGGAGNNGEEAGDTQNVGDGSSSSQGGGTDTGNDTPNSEEDTYDPFPSNYHSSGWEEVWLIIPQDNWG